jgi:integrase
MRGHIRRCEGKRGTTWAIVVYLGRGEVRDRVTGQPKIGERHLWKTFKTRTEAERYLAAVVHQVHGGATPPKATRLTLAEYLENWLRGHEPQVALTTFASYRDTIRNHLADALGRIPLPRVSPDVIRDYIARKLRTGLSPTTVRYHLMVLHQALGQAVRDGVLSRSPADLVRPPRKYRPEIRTFDLEQARLFLGEAKRSSPYYRLYLAAVTTGMRQGELLGLRWKDVDLTLGVARVQQTFYRLGGSKKDGIASRQLFKEPKTAKARRGVDLPEVLVAELRALREEQKQRQRVLGSAHEDLDLVFAQLDGKPLHAHNVVRRDFQKVLERAGLPRIRFHDLRYCHATLLLQQGVHPKVVQERLGHSTIAMTLDVYSHTVPGLQRQAVARLEDGLFDRVSTPGAD